MSTTLKRPTAETWKTQLSAVPKRNLAAAIIPQGPDTMQVQVKRQKPWFIVPPISWVIRLRPLQTYELDTLGKTLWELSDGIRDVAAIVDIFADQQRLTFHESRVLVCTYIQQLVQRGVLVLIGQEEPV